MATKKEALTALTALLTLSGCGVATMQKHWQDSAVRTARFDMNCKGVKVVGVQHGAVDSRYRVSGCDKTVVYLCEDASRGQMDAMDRVMLGGRSGDVTCRPVQP